MGSAFGAPGDTIADGWERLPPMPEENGGFGVFADSGGLTVAGGTKWENGVKQWLRTVSRLDFKSRRWSVLGTLPGPTGYASCGVASDGTRAMLGGSDGRAPVKAFGTIRDGRIVVEPAPVLPDKIVLCAGGIIGNEFIFAGGTDDATNIAGLTNRVFAFDLTKRTLAALPDFPGRPFGTAASCVLGGELFVFAGANWNESGNSVVNSADAHALDAARRRWRTLSPYPFAVRGVTALALDESHVYLAGGYGGAPERFLTEAFIFDARADSYAKATPLPYAASVGLVSQGGWVYCIGGEDRMRHRTDAVHRIAIGKLFDAPSVRP